MVDLRLELAAGCPKIAANQIIDLCGVSYPDRIGCFENPAALARKRLRNEGAHGCRNLITYCGARQRASSIVSYIEKFGSRWSNWGLGMPPGHLVTPSPLPRLPPGRGVFWGATIQAM
jgi:hypothetical protein